MALRKDKDSYVRLYQKQANGIWYMNLRDPETGKKIRKSSGTFNKKEAEAIFDREQGRLEAGSKGALFGDVISLYLDNDTNPRRKQAELDGKSYGDYYANLISQEARNLLSLLDDDILSMPLADIKSSHIKAIKKIIVDEYGHRRKSQSLFIFAKSIFSQAHEDGIIEYSPATGISNIAYKEHTRDSVSPIAIEKVLNNEKEFKDIKEEWAFFSVIATTGMRKSEALALSKEQIKDNFCIIDRALKNMGKDSLGLPKCDIIRDIALSYMTMNIISKMKADRYGRYFHENRSWGDIAIKKVTARASTLFPEYRDELSTTTAHILRHSLNTNLLDMGCQESKVAAYLGWNHQNISPMQKRYTHIHAKNLLPIAKAIDDMFSVENDTSI